MKSRAHAGVLMYDDRPPTGQKGGGAKGRALGLFDVREVDAL